MPSVRGVSVVGVLLVLLAGLLPGRADAQEIPPNVLVVVTDDQRAMNTLWVMPKTRAALERGGTRFTNAFAVTPLCCPSRATIFTGRYAHNTGVISQDSTPLDLTTLFPRLLQGAGYRTAMAGKFLNRWPFGTAPPYFDSWALLCLCGEDPLTFDINGVETPRSGHSTNLIGDYAAQFLQEFEEEDGAPWLLYVAPTSPHWPWTPATKYADAQFPVWNGNPAVAEQDRSDKPAFVRERRYRLGAARRVRIGQLRELKSVDDMVGRLMLSLDALNEGANTLVIFTSDNGFMWAEHGIGGDGGTAGQKRLPYTTSAKVPFLLRWPGRVPADVFDDRLVGTVDIVPTILDAASVAADPTKPPLDGRSLLDQGARDRILLEYWGEQRFPTWASVRTETYQYVEYYGDDGPTPTFREYYDLVRDPWQLRNLFKDGDPENNPDAVALHTRLAEDRACEGTGPPLACP